MEDIAGTLVKAALVPDPRPRYRRGLGNRMNTRLLTMLPTRSADRIKTRIAHVGHARETVKPDPAVIDGVHQATPVAPSKGRSR